MKASVKFDDKRERSWIQTRPVAVAVTLGVVAVVGVASLPPNVEGRLANAGTLVGGLAAGFAVLAAWFVYRAQDQRIMDERKRSKLHDLELSWYVGDLNRDRLAAERAIVKYPHLSLKELFTTLKAEEYDCISQVLRIFYLLNSWKEREYIDEDHARKVFGRSYHWWYTMLIEPHSVSMVGEDDFESDWKELVIHHEWLDVEPG